LSLRISDLLTLKYADLNLDERSLKLTEAKRQAQNIRLNSAASWSLPEGTKKILLILVVSSP